MGQHVVHIKLLLQVSNNDVTEKCYEDGSKFVIMFRDGTGTVLYPFSLTLPTKEGRGDGR
jgi:hypothetical protein